MSYRDHRNSYDDPYDSYKCESYHRKKCADDKQKEEESLKIDVPNNKNLVNQLNEDGDVFTIEEFEEPVIEHLENPAADDLGEPIA